MKLTLDETLNLLRIEEKESGRLLENALWLKRHRQNSNLELLQGSSAFYLPAVNSKARIKWGRIFIQQVFEFFQIADDQRGPDEPVFLVTIADKSHLTTALPQPINLSRIKRKLGAGLKGLSYVGMIEPGYYNVIYDEFGNQRKNVVSWHGHFLVWGATGRQLKRHLKIIKPRFAPIMSHFCAVHQKRIEPDQFGYKLWYILKSPCKEYSVGRRSCDDKTGAAKYKQNSRPLRPGHRVKLFYLMREIYLDQLAMAGGKGCKLLQTTKYEALREYRRHNGWHDRRP
jgi:hypothetical protein